MEESPLATSTGISSAGSSITRISFFSPLFSVSLSPLWKVTTPFPDIFFRGCYRCFLRVNYSFHTVR